MTNQPIFYVTPDPSRAIGLEKILPNYHIVCLDGGSLVNLMIKNGVKVFSLEKAIGNKEKILRNSGTILAHPQAEEYISKNSRGKKPNILFFKPSRKIETVALTKDYRLLGNACELNNLFEDKISFYEQCLSWGLPVPSGEVNSLESCFYEDLSRKYGPKLVFQFGHGWAGKTTFFIESEEELQRLQKKFPARDVRITRFIEGKTYLNNACVTKEEILVSPPAIQITAPEGFTANPGGTCGRQWPAGLSLRLAKAIGDSTCLVGQKMREQGYKGYFGLDFLVEEGTEQVFLSECNARLTASVPLYTKMEIRNGQKPLLLYHIEEFLGESFEFTGKEVEEMVGSELVIRNKLSETVVVGADFAPGIYTLVQNTLVKVYEDYSVEAIERPGEFFLSAAQKGRLVAAENEIAHLCSLGEILNEDSQVKEWAKKALLQVKELLKLKINGGA